MLRELVKENVLLGTLDRPERYKVVRRERMNLG